MTGSRRWLLSFSHCGSFFLREISVTCNRRGLRSFFLRRKVLFRCLINHRIRRHIFKTVTSWTMKEVTWRETEASLGKRVLVSSFECNTVFCVTCRAKQNYAAFANPFILSPFINQPLIGHTMVLIIQQGTVNVCECISVTRNMLSGCYNNYTSAAKCCVSSSATSLNWWGSSC